MTLRKITLQSSCALFLASLPLMAQAQNQAAASTTEASSEIIVTAQKKAQPLSKTPISLSVISADTFNKAQGHDLKDLQTLTSSLMVISDANEAQTTARLRGVGTVGDNPGLESSVGVVIDGVVRARTATAMSDLGQINQVAILKGAQTSLFGKGASAGLIQIDTLLPSFTATQSYNLSAGNMGLKALSAYISGPLSPTVAGSLSLSVRHVDGQYSIATGAGPRKIRLTAIKTMAPYVASSILCPMTS